MFYRNGSIIRQLILLRLLANRGGSQGQYVTVTGSSPLALVNSLAHAIRSLTQYGKCVQASTPTPSAPVDIVCNNGVLRYGKPITIDPTRYYAYISTENAWAYSMDSYSIVMPVTVGKKYKITADPTTPIDGSVVNVILRWGFVDTVYDSWKRSDGLPSSKSVAIYDFVRSTPQDTQSVEVTATHPFMVIQMGAAAFASNMANGRIGVAVQEVYTDGTPEELTVGGQNLVDLTAVTNGYCYSPSGVYTELSNARLTDYIPVKSGQKYTIYVKAVKAGTAANVRCNLFDTAQAWKSQSSFTVNSGSENVGVVTPSEDGYLRVSANYADTGARVDWSTLQIVRGEYTLSTMPPYEPYVTPQTVTVPMLLGVGNYKDEGELIAGIKTGRVGIKVLDGGADESWGYSQTSGVDRMNLALSDMLPVNYGSGLCTHLKRVSSIAEGIRFGASNSVLYVYLNQTRGFNSAALWKAFLADQYAAGTPVIVVYSLATETTEQTTPHSLHTVSGTTIVDAQTNVDPVELSVEYYASQAPGFGLGSPGTEPDQPGENPGT